MPLWLPSIVSEPLPALPIVSVPAFIHSPPLTSTVPWALASWPMSALPFDRLAAALDAHGDAAAAAGRDLAGLDGFAARHDDLGHGGAGGDSRRCRRHEPDDALGQDVGGEIECEAGEIAR